MKAYDALAAPSVVATPIHYGAVETGLFGKVIATYTGEPPATAPVREAQR